MVTASGQRIGAVAAVVAAVLPLLAACSLGGDEAAPSTTAPATTVTTDGPEGWSVPADELAPLPEAPAPLADGPVTIVGDRALVLVGENGQLDPAAPPQLFDPDDGSWTVLPAPPFEHRPADVSTVPLADGFLLVGTACDEATEGEVDGDLATFCSPGGVEAVRYAFADRRWHAVDLPGAFDGGDDRPGAVEVVAERPGAGEALIGWRDTTWRYQEDGGRWVRVQAPEGQVCGADDGFVAVGASSSDRSTAQLGARLLGGDGAWKDVGSTTIPEPLAPGNAVVCAPGSLVVIGRPELGLGGTVAYARSFDLADASWSEVAPPPPMERELVSAPVDDGAVVIARDDEDGPTTWHYVAAEQRWEPFALPLRIGTLSIRRDGVFVGDADIFGRRNVTTLTAIRLT